eukprot:SAG31_NODE_2419_length_5727_cov_4.235963_1_plen_85_part_00
MSEYNYKVEYIPGAVNQAVRMRGSQRLKNGEIALLTRHTQLSLGLNLHVVIPSLLIFKILQVFGGPRPWPMAHGAWPRPFFLMS